MYFSASFLFLFQDLSIKIVITIYCFVFLCSDDTEELITVFL